MTLPPKWWIFWWPRQWRRAHDVYERLPGRLKAARLLNGASMLLLLVEIPLVIWAMAPARLAIRELAPGNHALAAVRWIASLNGLSALVAMIVFLVVLTTVFTVSAWLASRVAKPFGLGRIDQRRLTIKPTDSPFWRDPRIQQVIRGTVTEKKPTNPQEYVSQILTVSGTLTPATSASGTAATAAARRLLDAITAIERELALLEKTSSREQLERFDAEIVLHESEGGDPEAISLLMNQREALIRARERMQTIAARRDDASERLDAIWADVKRLRSVADVTAANEIATQLTQRCEQITADFPPRQSGARTGVQRVTAAVALTLFLGGALVAAQTAGAPLTTVRSMLERGHPDSALAVLGEAPTNSADVAMLRGQAYSQHGSMKKVFGRVVDFRRAYAAFEHARALDPSRPEPLEALAWFDRLAPWYVGGSSGRAAGRLAELDRRSPYRAQLMRAYFDRLDGKPAAAEKRLRSLVTASPDSAAAWFGLGDLLSRQGRAEEALMALRRYRTLMPGDRSIAFHLGVVSAEHGVALAEGEAALKEYLSVPEHPFYPSLDAAWWRLGQVHAKRGAREDARNAFRKAIAIDGRDKDYQASLRALDDAGAAGR
jgi:tetratricopeptide (TPR) repeat protein